MKVACNVMAKPQNAPKDLLDRYGHEHGFGWKVGDVVGLDVVQVPLDQSQSAVRALASKQALFLFVCGTMLCLFAIYALRKLIIHRLDVALDTLSAVAQGDLRDSPIKDQSSDEMNSLLIGLEGHEKGFTDPHFSHREPIEEIDDGNVHIVR